MTDALAFRANPDLSVPSLVAAGVLVGLVLLAAERRRLGPWGAPALALWSLLWLLVNSPMEGVTFFSVSASHGLTGGDLAGLAGLGLAAADVVGRLRR